MPELRTHEVLAILGKKIKEVEQVAQTGVIANSGEPVKYPLTSLKVGDIVYGIPEGMTEAQVLDILNASDIAVLANNNDKEIKAIKEILFTPVDATDVITVNGVSYPLAGTVESIYDLRGTDETKYYYVKSLNALYQYQPDSEYNGHYNFIASAINEINGGGA